MNVERLKSHTHLNTVSMSINRFMKMFQVSMICQSLDAGYPINFPLKVT